jgi:endonuclease YncB( thermonuclease family)
MPAKTFTMWALVVRWVDGDTFAGVLDQGLYTYRGSLSSPIRMRCAIINAPEIKTPTGPLAKAYAEELAPPGEYPCLSYKPDEYGRPLVDLLLPGGRFSDLMLAAGHATVYGKE